ncbi:amidase family protein [Horticoccus sp. 23ND18S-11]|uniref:amidase family protein n=1 Tax=Horticoccus sp. 23ND18S-11 TaxID=3391832 RepID=UPI0039C93556
MKLSRWTVAALAAFGALTARAKTFDLATATVLDVQDAMTAGALTSEKLTQLYLARIAAYDQAGPKLNTIITLNPKALETARALDAERKAKGPRSPLHGVPIVLKDNFDTADLPTTGGSRALKGTVAPDDAFTVARLRAAGAIILAKANLDEFARGSTGTSSLGGQTLDPYVLDKIPGGSSAGTGSGVAAVFAQMGTGTETGSSIRSPSSNNNLVGISPSEGLVSRDGIIPISFTLDRGGPMARNVTDAAAMLHAMAGMDPADLTTKRAAGKKPAGGYLSALKKDALKGARIGVLRDLATPGADYTANLAVFDAAVADLKKAGAILVDPVSTGTDFQAVLRDVNMSDPEYKYGLNAYFATRGATIPVKTLTDLIANGGYLGRLKDNYIKCDAFGFMDVNADYLARLEGREVVRRVINELMDRYALDALVYPHRLRAVPTIADAAPDNGNAVVPPERSELTRAGGSARLSTVTGHPTVIVPAGFTPDGMPLGIEFFGRLFTEAKLIGLAYAYEQAATHRKLPAVTPPLAGEKFDY